MFKVLSESFTRRRNQEEAASITLLRSIPKCVSESQDLDSRLNALAELLVRLPGISGALVAACDAEGLPIAYGSTPNFSLYQNDLPFSFLEDLELESQSYDTWFKVRRSGLAVLSGPAARARRVKQDDSTLGLIVTQASALSKTQFALQAIDESLEHLAWAIRDGIRLEKNRISERLLDLALTDLGRLGPVKPQHIAGEIKDVFRADTVTIFAREHGKLFLSGTTDTELNKDRDANNPVEVLTPQILKTGKDVRLKNTLREEEIRENFEQQLWQEFEDNKEIGLLKWRTAFRLLAVPMRSGWEMEPQASDSASEKYAGAERIEEKKDVRGVIWVLRQYTSAPFSLSELKHLQRFADLLALAFYGATWLDLTQRIIKADAEAVCITYQERLDDHTVSTIVYADQGAEKLFGINRQDIVGKDAREMYASDEEYERVQKFLREALRKYKTEGGQGEYGPAKARVKRFAGKKTEERLAKISYRFVTSPIAQKAVHYTIAVIRDVTEDQHLVSLLDQRRLAYFRADVEGLTVETSRAESDLTGYPISDLLKMYRSDLYVDPEDRERLIERVHQADGRLVQARERLKKRDDTSFLAEGVVHLLKDPNGFVIGYEGLYEDVTDRMRLQGYLDVDPKRVLKEHELYEKLERNARLQLLLMTSLSHQLRSPLGALVGDLQNFKKGVTNASRFADRLVYSIGQAKVCSQLIANLSYMDLVLKNSSFDFVPVKLAKIAIEAKLDYEHLAAENDIVIAVEDKGIDKYLEVWGHEGLLRQVLFNLFDNAIKYSFRGSRIVVRAGEGLDKNYLEISNRGIGVPPHLREEIFAQGVRLKKAKMVVPDGTGLGLWLVRKILAIHDAEIVCTEIFEGASPRTAFQIFFSPEPVKRSVGKWRLS